MKNLSVLRNILSCLVLLALPSAASAGIFRAYLASTGNDANPCTLPQPCRLLPAALAAVNDGGEIWIMDSANFNTGTVTIDKSVSILAIPGALGSVVANGSDAIAINAPSSHVKLRSITIRSLAAPGNTGVAVTSVGSLLLEGVTMENLNVGLLASGPAVIKMKDALLRANTLGVHLGQGGGAVQVISIDNTSFFQNTYPIGALTGSTTGSVRVTIDNSVINGGGVGNGALAFGGAVAGAAPVIVSIMRSKIAGLGQAGFGTGVTSFGVLTVVTLADNHISGHYYGARSLNGSSGVGVLRTLGNNVFDDINSNGPLVPVSMQ